MDEQDEDFEAWLDQLEKDEQHHREHRNEEQ